MRGGQHGSSQKSICTAPWPEEAIFLHKAPSLIAINRNLVSPMLSLYCLYCLGKRSDSDRNSSLIAVWTVLAAKNLYGYNSLHIKLQRLKILPTFCLVFGFLVLIVAFIIIKGLR